MDFLQIDIYSIDFWSGIIIIISFMVIAWYIIHWAVIHFDEYTRHKCVLEQGVIADLLDRYTDKLNKNDANGEPDIEARKYALDGLGRLARDSISDHVQIMAIIFSYIRDNSPFQVEMTHNIGLGEDIKLAITIIQQCSQAKYGIDRDLSHCNLYYAVFDNADLKGVNFKESNLRGTRFRSADLSHAKISDTYMEHAVLRGAILHDTSITHTNIGNVDFSGANMTGAYLVNSYACKGDFSDCKNLTQKQLDWMYCGSDVKIPDGLTRPEHWPTDEIDEHDFEDAYEEWLKKKTQ